MTNIIEFHFDQSRNRPRTTSAPLITGEIVIFPGVRVSYWDDVLGASDDVPPKPEQSNKKSKGGKRR